MIYLNTIISKIGIVVGGVLISVAGFFGVQPETPSFGSVVPITPGLFETSLAAPITSSATTMTLANGTLIDGTTLSGYTCFTVDSGQPNVEFICGTASGTVVSSLLRGVNPLNGTSTVASLQFSHRRGANVKITDYPALSIQGRILNGLDGLSAPIYYDSGVSQASIMANTRNLVTYGMLASTTVAGGVPATPSIAGISKLSTVAASTTDPIVVGDNDTRVPTQSENDALVGSFGSPSTSNPYITSLDATSTPTAGRVVRFTSDGSVSGAAISGFVGNGTDGASTTSSGTTTLTSDVYYTNLTVATGTVLVPNGYRIFVNGTLTVNGTISLNGRHGASGAASSTSVTGNAGGVGGTATASGTLAGGVSGINGASGSNGSGGSGAGGGGSAVTPTTTLNVVGNLSGVVSGASGSGGSGAGGGGGGGAATSSASSAVVSKTLPNAAQFAINGYVTTDSISAFMKPAAAANGGNGGGGGGGGTNGGGGGGGGGGGASGGLIGIYAKNIVIGSSGSIQAVGGNGGNGGGGNTGGSQAGGGGGGGGGAGGNGGVIMLVYGSLTNNGTISVAGGLKGSAGAFGLAGGGGGGTNGLAGNDGSNGVSGVIYYVQI